MRNLPFRRGGVRGKAESPVSFAKTSQYELEDPYYSPSPKQANSEPRCSLANELKTAPGVVPSSAACSFMSWEASSLV